MKFYLIVAKGKKQGMPIPIEVDLFLIGGDPICQLRCVHDAIGGQHCALVSRGNKVFISDLGSGEPTIVNGSAIPSGVEWPLHLGDRIKVGPLEFVIQFREKQLSQRDLEEWALKCLDEDVAKNQRKSALEEIDDLTGRSGREGDPSSIASAILDRMSAARGVVRGRLRIALEQGMTVVRINDVYLVDEAELLHLNKELHENLAVPNLRVLVDFKNVKRMSSAAAELFSELKNWLGGYNSKLAFCRLKPELQGVMQSTLRGVKMFADKSTAVKAQW